MVSLLFHLLFVCAQVPLVMEFAVARATCVFVWLAYDEQRIYRELGFVSILFRSRSTPDLCCTSYSSLPIFVYSWIIAYFSRML